MNFASLFPAFLALASISEGVYAQSVVEPLVQYTFNDNTDRLKNTGTGDDVLNLTLDGVLFPAEENGIVFDQDTALFTGQGCIEVPKSRYINGKVSQMRTILLDFFWDGFKNPNHEPQILFEEGGKTNGINIVLRTKEQSDEAELVMGVWEGDNADVILERLFITCPTKIEPRQWYKAMFELYRTGSYSSENGMVVGYLDETTFESNEIDWFGISAHTSRNCIGGMRQDTRIFNGTAPDQKALQDGLYFYGKIDNFTLYSSLEIPNGNTRFLRGDHDE